MGVLRHQPAMALTAVEATEGKWAQDVRRGEDNLVRLLNEYRASWALIRQWAGHDVAIAQREAEIQRLEWLVWDAAYAFQKAGLDERRGGLGGPSRDAGRVHPAPAALALLCCVMSTILSALLAAERMAAVIEQARLTAAPLLFRANLERSLANSLVSPEQLLALHRLVGEFWRQAEPTKREEPGVRELYALLAQRGWVGLENHIPAGDEPQILKAIKENGSEWIDGAVCESFRDADCYEIKDMLKDWWSVPYLADRREAIEDAIKAHEEGRYALSIPALLPLVDGLAAEIVDAPTWRPLNAINNAANEYHLTEQEPWSECLLTVITEQVYKTCDFRSTALPTATTLNRHAVLHGRVARYASEANSLRTILLVDVFAQMATTKPRAGHAA